MKALNYLKEKWRFLIAFVVRRFSISVLGYCPHCKRYFKFAKTFRTNTAYNDDTKNFDFACNECQKYINDYWDEMWAMRAREV
jgi:hypothetical protein